MSIKTKIIAGELKGRFIELPDIETTRPTKSIIRESFFNVVGREIYSLVFVEAFAGSGSMGIEALSRECKGAIFFEYNKIALNTLNKNLKSLNLKADVHFGDTFDNLPNILKSHQEKDLWIYLDPPFNIREDQEEIYEKTENLIKNLNKNSVAAITVEHLSTVKFPSEIGDFSCYKSKKFGKTTLSYYR